MTELNVDPCDSNDPANWYIPGISSDSCDRAFVFRNYPRVKAAVLAYETAQHEKRARLRQDHVARYGHEGPYRPYSFGMTIPPRP